MATKSDSGLYVAIMSFTHDPFSIKEGDRVRGDHPERRRLPQMFLPDGSTSEELANARQALTAAALARNDS